MKSKKSFEMVSGNLKALNVKQNNKSQMSERNKYVSVTDKTFEGMKYN